MNKALQRFIDMPFDRKLKSMNYLIIRMLITPFVFYGLHQLWENFGFGIKSELVMWIFIGGVSLILFYEYHNKISVLKNELNQNRGKLS